MAMVLPATVVEFMSFGWDEIHPFFAELTDAPLTGGTLDAWLTGWTRLADLLEERMNRHYIATAVDTSDGGAQAAYLSFLEDILPAARSAEQMLKEKLLSSGLEPAGFAIPLRNLRAESELFSDANQPLLSEDLRLGSEYDRVVGAQTVEWQGEEKTVPQVLVLLQENERDLRERAWRAAAARQLADRQAIDRLWQQLLDIRRAVAGNAGFADYRSFRWRQLLRFDYSPADCLRFHEAIEETVVPAAERLNEYRRRRLGLDRLRPWDLDVDPSGQPPLRPFETAAELEGKASAAFAAVSPDFAGYFDTMRREGLLDLENRRGKAPGGFSLDLPVARRPYIFTNAVGAHDDVQTVLHEGGHAFHTFESARLPYSQQRTVPMEFSEVASMAMEFLASPHLERAGFYSRREAARARTEDLERTIRFWPYMAIVDAFQHWAYEYPHDAREPARCEDTWQVLSERFRPGTDWTGLEEVLRNGWRTRLHIFSDPFYYVEYGLAQLGAVQVWARSLEDPDAAVEGYRRALSLGGTVSLPDLYRAAGARLAFDSETLHRAVSLLEATIDDLRPVSEGAPPTGFLQR